MVCGLKYRGSEGIVGRETGDVRPGFQGKGGRTERGGVRGGCEVLISPLSPLLSMIQGLY
jgi:hypothetical protein